MYYLESQKIDHQVLNGIADLVRVLNVNNEVVFVNKAMKELLGLDDEKGVCDVKEFLYSYEITNRALLTAEVIQREEIYGDKCFSVMCSPVIGPDSKVIGVVEVFRNITNEKKLQRAIVDKNKAMTIETVAASKVQHSLLPEKGFLKNLKIDYIYRPANILSGDIFDVFSINEDLSAIYIADTVGHGFAASMVTMFIKSAMRTMPTQILQRPSLTLRSLYKKFMALKLDLEHYFTCFYAIYSKKKNQITFANAGHFPVGQLIRDNTIIELEAFGRPISQLLTPDDYKEESINVFCGDKLLFMTDGIAEQKNELGEYFGMDRVTKIVASNEIDELQMLEDILVDYIDLKQKDDLSAVLLHVW